MVKSFEDLDAFKRAYRLSLDIHTESLKWPDREQRVIGDQIRRSSKSIYANIAEGFRQTGVIEEGIQSLPVHGDWLLR